jgi:peptidoglycan hydrolase-like protein with peptidoglycan-binding domain
MSYAVVRNGGLLGMGLYGLFGLGAFVGSPKLSPGSTNVALIKQLQVFLGQLKANGLPDGSFGPKTTTAVAAFQSSHGVPATGIVDAATWAAIDAAIAAGAPAAGGGAPGAAVPASGGGTAALPACPAGTHFTGMSPAGAQLCEQDVATPTVGVGPGQTIDTGPGPGGGAATTAGGGGGTTPSGGGPLLVATPFHRITSWWAAQSTPMKGGVVAGGVLAVVLLAMAFGGGPTPAREPYTGTATATPNRRRRRRKKTMKANGRRRRGGRKPKGGHRVAPAKYRRMGATARSDYAYPAGFMYPIRFHKGRKVKRRTTIKHIRAAAARFGKFARRYPSHVRKTIRARIAKAERQYHIGRYR